MCSSAEVARLDQMRDMKMRSVGKRSLSQVNVDRTWRKILAAALTGKRLARSSRPPHLTPDTSASLHAGSAR